VILDEEQQREMLLEIISSLQFRGTDIEKMYHLKQAIINAEVELKDG